SRHHHHSKRRIPVWARVLIIIFAILFAAVAIIGGTYLGLREKGQNDLVVEQANPKYEETVEYNGHTYIYDKNKVAFAFIGVDSEKVGKNDGLIGTSGQADTDMVAVVDTATGKVSIITVPRDTMVDIDLYSTDGKFLRTENMQVCLSYAYGDGAESSCKNTTTALSRILANVPIEKYFVLDLKGIAPLNDAIGGVTVESLYDFPDQNIKKGDKVTIMGDFAETYVRKRDTNTINASLNRTARQSQYIKAYAEQLRKAVTSDFSTISNLYNTASKYSQTNISLSDVTYLASVVLQHGVTEVNQYTIDGEMKASSEVSEDVFAEYYADSDSVMEIVLNCFYQQVS
ncbi:MAG: LCP family protein, partial [Eubacterium sp.]